MKYRTYLLTILFVLLPVLGPSLAFAEGGSGEPNSGITHVVVYPNHAQVTREISVDTSKGENVVTFTGLVPILDTSSLRATASGGARITGTETKNVFLKESRTEEIKALDKKILGLNDQIAEQSREGARWNEERGFYLSLKTRLGKTVDKEIGKEKISIQDWKELLKFVREGLAECDKAMADIEVKNRELAAELAKLNAERNTFIQHRGREMKEITVSFSCDRSGGKAVRVHYIVPSVNWRPIYDVHLDRKSKKSQIIGYGQVTQRTGENWDNVKVTLAMSRPDVRLDLPEMNPVIVSLNPQEIQQFAADVRLLNTQSGSQTREWSKQRFKSQQDEVNYRRNLEQLSQVSDAKLKSYGLSQKQIAKALTRLVDRFAGVRFDLKKTETIPCDGSPHKVVIFSSNVPVELKHVATPALGDTVVLKGDIKNATGFAILDGPVSLFIDNSFVGTSQTTAAAQNEGLSFCFGPDDTLVVERKLLSRKVKGPESFRQSQIVTYEYRITVENFNDRTATVEVSDQIPVSKTSDIQVKFINPDDGDKPELDDETGKLTWVIEIPRGKKKEITFSFSVECPVGRTVYWK